MRSTSPLIDSFSAAAYQLDAAGTAAIGQLKAQ
jgi:hypothetical protein